MRSAPKPRTRSRTTGASARRGAAPKPRTTGRAEERSQTLAAVAAWGTAVGVRETVEEAVEGSGRGRRRRCRRGGAGGGGGETGQPDGPSVISPNA